MDNPERLTRQKKKKTKKKGSKSQDTWLGHKVERAMWIRLEPLRVVYSRIADSFYAENLNISRLERLIQPLHMWQKHLTWRPDSGVEPARLFVRFFDPERFQQHTIASLVRIPEFAAGSVNLKFRLDLKA